MFGAVAGGPAPLVAERLPDADAAFRHGVADRAGMDGLIRVHLVRVFLRKALELALQLGVVGVDAGGGFFLVVEDDGLLLQLRELPDAAPLSNSSRKRTLSPVSSSTAVAS